MTPVHDAFRCFPDGYGRQTNRRLSKAENVLYLDLVFSEDRFSTLPKDRQRYELSHEFLAYTAESLNTYRLEGLDVPSFLADLDALCRGIGWLKEEWQVDL